MRDILCWLAGLRRHRRAAGQFTRFCIVGTANFFLDNGIYVVLTRRWDFWSEHFLSAATVSFVAAVISSFILNTFWTFRCDAAGWHRRIGKFFVVAVGGLFINALTLELLIELGIYDLVAKVAAAGVVLVWNFLFQKKWTFRL